MGAQRHTSRIESAAPGKTAKSVMKDLSGTEWLWGRQVVLETLAAGRRKVGRVCMNCAAHGGEIERIRSLAAERGAPVVPADEGELDVLCRGGNHQGVAAAVSSYPYVELESIAAAGPDALIVVLDHIQDPQNLGSILRTAECAGATGVVIAKDRAVGVTPSAVRASAGASEYARVARVVNIARSLRELRDAGFRVVGLESVPEAEVHTEADLSGPIVLVVGGEDRGVSRLAREACDVVVRIPIFGRVGSLNAGVAFGIAIYEILRQRKNRGA